MKEDKFEQWAIVELFGHAQIAGKVTEATIGGCSFLRVDVPAVDGRPGFTKFFGNGAIYSMTPCGEQVALAAVKQIRAAPINVYIPSLQKLLESNKQLELGERDEREPWCDDCNMPEEICECPPVDPAEVP